MVPNRCQIFGITLLLSLCLKKLELENTKLSRGPFMQILKLEHLAELGNTPNKLVQICAKLKLKFDLFRLGYRISVSSV